MNTKKKYTVPRQLTLVLMFALISAAGTAFSAPALNAAGRCQDKGKFVAARLCATTTHAGKCRNVTTKKFAKCGTAGTEPVPQSSTSAAGK
jgi:hypothetical protein